MTIPMRLLANNVADTATASAVTASGSFPASNLLLSPRGKEFRTSDASANREIRLSWASNQTLSMVAVCRHNWTGSATWRVQIYSDDAWTTQLEDSGTVGAFDAAALGSLAVIGHADVRGLKNSVYYLSTTRTTVRSVKVTLNDTGNPDGYLSATRMFAGQYQAPGRAAAFGLSLAWDEDSAQTRMQGGSLRTASTGSPWRDVRVKMAPFESADRTLWSDLYRFAGLRRDLWIDVYPDDAGARGVEHRGAFRFATIASISHEHPAHYLTEYTLREA